MPQAPLTEAQMQEALDLVRLHGSVTEAAEASGFKRATLQDRYSKAKAWATEQGVHVPAAQGRMVSPTPKPFDVEELPDELPTAEELIARRTKEFDRKRTASEARSLISVKVKATGPIGIAIVGDPHVDDPGTDIRLLRDHLRVISDNEAMFPLGIGDYSNNWVGRLARLYGQQSTSAAEAWVLVEWLVKEVTWLALVAGNHDCWSGAGDPIKWMARAARTQYSAHGVRLGLNLPIGRTIRLNARHDFTGRSQWNTAFGVGKAAQMGWHDHILTAGHTHVSGIQVVRDQMSGLISHCLRVGSYKTMDSYADEKGLPNQTFMVCPTVVIRPQFPDDDNRLLTTFFEPETASEFLAWLRSRKSEAA